MNWVYPGFDPVFLEVGPIAIYWYGMMYVFACLAGWLLGRILCKRKVSVWTPAMVDDAVFYMALGAVVGGRLGYVAFYNLAYYLEQPLRMFEIWQGGMSFHGGLLGVIAAMLIFARRYHMSVLSVSDFVAVCCPAGLAFGRIGNFINSELWGKVTTSPWGMLVQDPVYGMVRRYPTQLLEALLEGVVLGVILWWVAKRNTPRGLVSGLFLVLYGLFRGFAELYRTPDSHIGYLYSDWLTMGQLLSFPMMLVGLLMIYWAYQPRRA